MEIKLLYPGDKLWDNVADYATNCTWDAGKYLAKRMRQHEFTDWEAVFVALDGMQIAGYCALTKTDCLPDVLYTPYIGFVFVGENYRGKRVSEKMISAAASHANSIGFDKVYIVSDHVNLYEKYGFAKIDKKMSPWGNLQSVFVKSLGINMQQTVDNFINKYNLHTNEQTRYIDLVSEVGELGKEILKSNNYGREEYKQTPGATVELGDCLFSLLALCTAMNINAETALQTALQKYEARFVQKGNIGS